VAKENAFEMMSDTAAIKLIQSLSGLGLSPSVDKEYTALASSCLSYCVLFSSRTEIISNRKMMIE
jgi:hypothetical protein